MVVRKMQRALVGRAGLVVLAAVGFMLVSASVSSAAAPATDCGGWLSRSPTTDEPNQLTYHFQCNWGITAYTLIVTRQAGDTSTMDDFSPNALISDPAGNPLSTVSFNCAAATLPGNGVSCFTGSLSVGMPAPDFATGQIDTSDPYCPSVPAGSPAGTKPEPAANVQLVITDGNGVMNGPFALPLAPGCPRPKPKPKPKPKHKTKHHTTSSHR